MDERAESEQIRPRIDDSPIELFRRHVLEGSDHVPVASQRLLGRHRRRLRVGRRDGLQLRHAKVEELRTRPGQHDVGRLEVTVHDAAPMRMVERFGNLDRVAQNLIRRQGTVRQAAGNGFAFQQFHDEVGAAVLFADVVERADVRVIQARDGPGFALESLL